MTIIGQVTPVYFSNKVLCILVENSEISQKYVPYQVGKYEKSFTLLKMAMTRLTSYITISLAANSCCRAESNTADGLSQTQ